MSGVKIRTAAGAQPDPFPDLAVAMEHLYEADPALAHSIDAAGPLAAVLKPTRDVFSGLVEAIVYQQLSGKAAATIHARLLARLGDSGVDPMVPLPERVLAADDEQLRRIGLSRAKVSAVRDLAERADSGILPSLAALHRMDDRDVIDQLAEIRGVGPWTAEMFLIFRLGRADVLPAHDFGVRKGFASVFGVSLPAPEDVLRRGERWKPYRTVASCHFWRVLTPQVGGEAASRP
jgi:3-methyladenine DNA glycosylase/8-oxoguanine DNA glycosylase